MNEALRYLFVPHVGVGAEVLTGTIPKLYELGFRAFQLHLVSPKSLDLPSQDVCNLVRGLPKDVRMIVHSNYLVNMVSHSRLWTASLQHTAKMLEVCDGLGVENYVTHLGAIHPEFGESLATAAGSTVDFLTRLKSMYDGSRVVLCLENDSGSRKGSKVADLRFVSRVVRHFNVPTIKVCFDTEHAYAHGCPIVDPSFVEDVLRDSAVVHLNAVPDKVFVGSFLDQHSETRVSDSRESVLIVSLASAALDHGLPMVLERKGLDIILDDVRFLAGSLRERLLDKFGVTSGYN